MIAGLVGRSSLLDPDMYVLWLHVPAAFKGMDSAMHPMLYPALITRPWFS